MVFSRASAALRSSSVMVQHLAADEMLLVTSDSLGAATTDLAAPTPRGPRRRGRQAISQTSIGAL